MSMEGSLLVRDCVISTHACFSIFSSIICLSAVTDVIGVVQNVSPTMSIRRKSNNETVPKRDITIADETYASYLSYSLFLQFNHMLNLTLLHMISRKKTVVVSLWNDLATSVGQELLDMADKSPVVAIKALKVTEFQGNENNVILITVEFGLPC